VSFVSSELTRGARSAWRCAHRHAKQNSSCDALGGEDMGTEEDASLEETLFGVGTRNQESSPTWWSET
jgi:hypothetical protein